MPSVLHPDEAEAEVGEVVGRDNLGLGRIDLEAELSFDEPHHGVHYPVGCGMASYHDDAVVRIACETEVPRLKFFVELVEHDVGEKRGEVSSLRGSLLRRLEVVSDHHSRLEELPYQRLGVAVADDPSDKAHQPVLRDVVEELLEVDVDDPYVAVVEILQGLHNGVLTSPSRPEAVGAVAEDGFEDGGKHLCDCLLDDPVYHRGYAELPFPAVGLGYLDPSHRLWLVRSRPYLSFDFLEVFLQVGIEFLRPHPVHAKGTAVGDYPLFG